jgi:uncharacterized protein
LNSLIKFSARPRLRSPYLLASWPGVANVSLSVATYIEKKLGLKPLARVNAMAFFDPIGVTVRNNVIESPQFPGSEFFYWKNPKGSNDLIVFIGEDQPQARIYQMADLVLDVAEKYGVPRVYTCAAALTKMHHTETPRVWGAATTAELAMELKKRGLMTGGTMQIAGLNGLLLGIAKERGTEGICLLGEVPQYASRIPNPMAALAIIKVLNPMLGIEIDTEELAVLAEEVKERMKQAASVAMGEYIDNFTEPIWESGAEGEDGEDEEEPTNEN